MSHRFNSIKSKHSLFTILFSLQFLSIFPSLVPSLPPSLSGEDLDLFTFASASPVTLDRSSSEGFAGSRPTPLNFDMAGGDSPEEVSLSCALPQGPCRKASREFSMLESRLFKLKMAAGSQDPIAANNLLTTVQIFIDRNKALIANNGLLSDDPSAFSKDACDRLLESAKSAAILHGAVIAAAAATSKAE